MHFVSKNGQLIVVAAQPKAEPDRVAFLCSALRKQALLSAGITADRGQVLAIA